MESSFRGTCEICGTLEWKVSYEGPIRDGAFGSLTVNSCSVAECLTCGVQRLDEPSCRDEEVYADQTYRHLVGEGASSDEYWSLHDSEQVRNLDAVWRESLRGKTVVDVGCGAGSFLDSIHGLAEETIGIEPCVVYHETLRSQGHKVHASLEELLGEREGFADLACCFSVIEHVANPKDFLQSICRLLRPEGILHASTPNRDDVLVALLPEDYARFFYRTVHRWYFDRASLAACGELGGFSRADVRCYHRFGFANTLLWLRDRGPAGDTGDLRVATPLMDQFWKSYLESEGMGDYLYSRFQKTD